MTSVFILLIYSLIFFSCHGRIIIYNRALDKRGYLMIIEGKFFLFSSKLYVVTPHLHCLGERGHNMLLCRINKNYP